MIRQGTAVAVISKLPRAGHSKTRLARTLGEPAALALHRAFLADELSQLSAPERWSLYLIHDPPRAPDEAARLAALLGGGAQGIVPGGAGLAQELLGGAQQLLARHQRVVIVSGDVPQLSPGHIERALAALDRADLVLGPGPDGGYYLVGLKAPHDIFTPITMSTEAVVQATAALARRAGLEVALLERLTDIDEAQDLLVLEGVAPDLARRTRAVVDTLERGELAPALPPELQIEVTSRCNLRCSGCKITYETLAPAVDLSEADLREILDAAPGLKRVAFQLNGEPLLNPALPAMIAEAARRGIHTVLNTNGTLLDAPRRRGLLESGLDELRVSLDGASPETVRPMARADIFARVVEGVRSLALERTGETPRIGLWMVATRENIGDLPALVRLAAEIGADEVYLQRLVTFGQGAASQEHSLHGRVDDTVRALVASAEAIAAETGVALRASGRRPPLESLRPSTDPRPQLACWRPWRSAVVTASKKVLPCCISSFLAPYEVLERGDLGREDLTSIWNGGRYRALRRGILEGEPLPFCADCGLKWSL